MMAREALNKVSPESHIVEDTVQRRTENMYSGLEGGVS